MPNSDSKSIELWFDKAAIDKSMIETAAGAAFRVQLLVFKVYFVFQHVVAFLWW